MKKIITILVAIALAGFLIYAINFQKKTIPVEKPGKVSVTGAYEKHFGAAPPVDKGTAYAFVIYFPSRVSPGKVVPFPFFTFDEASLKKVAIDRLLSGMDISSYQGEFLTVPSGIRIVSLNETQGTVTLTLSKEFTQAVEHRTADNFIRAIALTLRQFNGVSAVRFQAEGSAAVSDVQADQGAILEAGPPRLLSVTAMRDKGAKDVEDVNAFFDRPVEIKELKLLSTDGQSYAGELFHSVFDMAAVLKPKDPSQFKKNMPVKVCWKVIDKLSRQAEGDSIWLLDVKEH